MRTIEISTEMHASVTSLFLWLFLLEMTKNRIPFPYFDQIPTAPKINEKLSRPYSSSSGLSVLFLHARISISPVNNDKLWIHIATVDELFVECLSEKDLNHIAFIR